MISRVAFDEAFGHAMRIRGLTLSDVARPTGFALATVSRAAAGRPVNMNTALLLAQAVFTCPIVPELEALVDFFAVPPAILTMLPSTAS
jgi:hypothetical protein